MTDSDEEAATTAGLIDGAQKARGRIPIGG